MKIKERKKRTKEKNYCYIYISKFLLYYILIYKNIKVYLFNIFFYLYF